MKVPQQPEVNIGLIGHVDHGKTTLTHALSGEWTDKHSEEIKRGISIRLGYADTAFYKCQKCPEPQCYSYKPVCPICGAESTFLRAVSFVDSPGHETLMPTMLSSAAIMDGAILLVAANESCPQPQTREHLMALGVSDVSNIVIVQNKVDLVTEQEALKNYQQIKAFVKGTIAEKAPVIPVSAHRDKNIDDLIMALEKYIPTPKRNRDRPLKMFVARSFDVNLPGTEISKLRGGIIGGTIREGTVSVGDRIDIAPGIQSPEGKWQPINTEVVSLFSGGAVRDKGFPGGLVAIGTKLDPFQTKSDNLAGRLAGIPDTLPAILDEITIETHLLEQVVGLTVANKVTDIKTGDTLLLSVATAKTVGIVRSARKGVAEVKLKIPICADKGQRIAISRNFQGKWRLIGHGLLK